MAKPVPDIAEQVTNTRVHRSKGSALRSVSALGGRLEENEDITYHIMTSWSKVPTTAELIAERVQRRNRYGWQVDFDDFKLPFLQNVEDKMAKIQAADL